MLIVLALAFDFELVHDPARVNHCAVFHERHRPVSDSVPESIRLAVRMLVEPILRDVRMMLAHGDPGFHLSAALVLASVIAGLSRVFFSTTRKTGEAFVDAASRYPLQVSRTNRESSLRSKTSPSCCTTATGTRSPTASALRSMTV